MSQLFTILKEKRTERKTVSDAATKILTGAHQEKRSLTAEESAEFEKRFSDVDKLGTEISQLEKQYEMEQTLGAPTPDGRSAGRENIEADRAGLPKEKREQWENLCFRSWCSGGPQGMNPEMRSQYLQMQSALANDEQPEVRALSDVTGATGAYTVPQGFVYKLETALKYYGGIITAADYIPTEMGNLLPWPTINDTTNTGETIAENTAVAGATGGAAEQDPGYGTVNFSAYMSDSGFVRVPVQLLMDSAFDVETYLVDLLKIRIGRRKNTLCTTGTGSSQPTGFVTAISALSNSGITGASPTTISYNEILGLLHSVDPAYRTGAKVGFMFSDSTLLAIRKLVDGNSRPLFIAGGVSEGIQRTNPDTLCGYQFYINQDMASLGSSNYSVAFGDWSKYKIREVRQLQMVRLNERFMDQLQVGFLAWLRFDGNMVDAGTRPIKLFRNSAT